MEITTGDINNAQGGPHSVEITVDGEPKIASGVLSASRDETKLLAIDLSGLGFSKSCIKMKDIDNIVLVAGSNDGLYFVGTRFFATFFSGDFNDNWVDGDSEEEYLRVPVYP